MVIFQDSVTNVLWPKTSSLEPFPTEPKSSGLECPKGLRLASSLFGGVKERNELPEESAKFESSANPLGVGGERHALDDPAGAGGRVLQALLEHEAAHSLTLHVRPKSGSNNNREMLTLLMY